MGRQMIVIKPSDKDAWGYVVHFVPRFQLLIPEGVQTEIVD
jgi:hypothetical protein